MCVYCSVMNRTTIKRKNIPVPESISVKEICALINHRNVECNIINENLSKNSDYIDP